MSSAGAPATPRMAWLASRYPAVSHTFILNEVRRLRSLGLSIDVASINAADRPPGDLTAEEREEQAATFYVKQAGIGGALVAHLATLASRPRGYLRGLSGALALGGADLRRLLYGWFYFTEALLVGRWMCRRGASHLHVHFANPAASVGLLVRRTFPVSFSITVHGPDEFQDPQAGHLARKIAAADFLCCISHFARSQLMLHSAPEHWTRFEVNRMGVDPARFSPANGRPGGGSAPGPGNGPFELLCVGRLCAAKGQHVLVGAVARLAAAGRDVRLRLVGDGPGRAGLQQAIAERGLAARVRLEGAVNHDRVRAFYAATDAFVLASFAEGVPVVLMEAMAMELPCIATGIAGIPELIRHAEDGLLVPPSDEEALAAAIVLLMDDRELGRRLGRAGRRRVLAEYDLQRNTGELAAIFERRLGAPLRSPAARGP